MITARAGLGGVDWWVQRLATSDRYQTDPHRVRYVWTYAEQLEAHRTLDALDAVQQLYRPPPAAG